MPMYKNGKKPSMPGNPGYGKPKPNLMKPVPTPGVPRPKPTKRPSNSGMPVKPVPTPGVPRPKPTKRSPNSGMPVKPVKPAKKKGM